MQAEKNRGCKKSQNNEASDTFNVYSMPHCFVDEKIHLEQTNLDLPKFDRSGREYRVKFKQ